MSITKSALYTAVETGRLSHAILITGQKNELFKIAIDCASMIFCKQSSCGECQDCKMIKANTHPDLLMLSAEKKSIGVDSIRNTIAELSKKGFSGQNRIAMIVDGDKMTVQAQNCLLKTLEDPPPGRTFIILCEKENQLLSTVVSRCMVVRTTPQSQDEVAKRIAHETGQSIENAKTYARLGQGYYEKAMEYATKQKVYYHREWAFETLTSLFGKGGDVLKGYAYLKDNKNDTSEILSILLDVVKDVLLCKNSGKVLSEDYQDSIIKWASISNGDKLHKIIMEISEASSLVEHNVNHQMTMESLLLKINDITED